MEDKGNRVHNYHKLTVAEAGQFMASMGVSHPEQLTPQMLHRRIDELSTRSYAELFPGLKSHQLLTDPPIDWAEDWETADPDHFGILATTPKRTHPVPINQPTAEHRPIRKDVKTPRGRVTKPIQSSGNRPEAQPRHTTTDQH